MPRFNVQKAIWMGKKSVTNSYLVLWEFNTSQKELLLVSSRSISFLISGGDSGDSLVLVCALDLLWLGGVLDYNAEDVSGELACNSSFFSVLQDDITQ